MRRGAVVVGIKMREEQSRVGRNEETQRREGRWKKKGAPPVRTGVGKLTPPIV